MSENNTIFIGGGGEDYTTAQELLLKFGNRHGMIAGATGTGKTVTLQILAESFSKAGVPVFLADVKGDLSGLAVSGSPAHKLHDKLVSRAEKIGFEDYDYEAFPVTFWDLFGEQGHPIRTTITEMGPLLLSQLMELSEAQEGVLNIAFRLADEQGLLLIDLKDLRALLNWMGENAADLTLEYGSVHYATFLMWLLSELFENLPEVGDPDRPKFVFFFDEAHLLFDDAPKSLIQKVEQVARLIRSKGVGVYFVSQNPDDVPDDILGQLGNRVQHALRAFTPRDQKALRLAAETFRPNPRFSTQDAIRDCGVGEALVSLLEGKGAPSVVERTLIRPPSSRLGPIDMAERKAVMAGSPVAGLYEEAKDRESAFEILQGRAEKAAEEAEAADKAEVEAKERAKADKGLKLREFNSGRRYSADEGRSTRKSSRKSSGGSRSDSIGKVFAKSLARQLGGRAGRSLVRGVMGGLFKGR